MMTARLAPFIALALAAGCSRETDPMQRSPAPAISGLPREVTISQRAMIELPGSAGAVRLAVDDVTGGRVSTSLVTPDGGVLLAPTPLRAGESAPFELGGAAYVLTLKSLENHAVGSDTATFVVAEASPPVGAAAALTETEKIEALLASIAAMKDAKFIRNGDAHDAQAAADHLRGKWRSAGSRITTAEQFIDGVASKSSLSGEAYKIRRADGTEVLAGEFLHAKLAEIERR